MSTTLARPAAEPLALTYAAAGELLGVSARTVFSLVARGELRAARFGRSVRIRRAELERFLAEREAAYSGGAAR
jgi:excisionase family DNA binding protein